MIAEVISIHGRFHVCFHRERTYIGLKSHYVYCEWRGSVLCSLGIHRFKGSECAHSVGFCPNCAPCTCKESQ